MPVPIDQGMCRRIQDIGAIIVRVTTARTLTITLCLLATPALADVAGIPTVIDGDTIEVHGQRIRLHGIDAPESRRLCRLDGKPWQCGKDAANALADVVARQNLVHRRNPGERAIGRIASRPCERCSSCSSLSLPNIRS